MTPQVSSNGLWRIVRENLTPPAGSFAEDYWEIILIHVPTGKVALKYSGEASGRVGHGNWDTEWSRGIGNLVFTDEQDGLILTDASGSETRLEFPVIEVEGFEPGPAGTESRK